MDDLSRTLSTLSPSMICLKSLSALVSFSTPCLRVARAGTKAQSSIGAHSASNWPRVMYKLLLGAAALTNVGGAAPAPQLPRTLSGGYDVSWNGSSPNATGFPGPSIGRSS